MTSTRITGGILVLLLVSILSFEVAGMGISSYLSNSNDPNANYLAMILEAVAIAVIAVVLMVTMFSLFSNLSSTAKAKRLALKVSTDLVEKSKTANQALMKMHEHEKNVHGLITKLHQRFENLDKLQSSAESRGAELEQMTDNLHSYQRDLQRASDSIGTRLNQVQTYWDEQLEETVDTVQRIRSGLGASLSRVDGSMERLKEQEIMAQQFTRKVVKNYEQQVEAQKENNSISAHVRESLEATLGESNQLLQHLQTYHKNAENTFNKFSNTMEDYEIRVYEEFEGVFASTDSARQELQAGLDESKHVVETLKAREKDTQDLSDIVTERLDSLEVERVEIMTKTLKDTSDLCSDLKQGMDKTQDVLYGLKSINSSNDDTNLRTIGEITTSDDHLADSNNVVEEFTTTLLPEKEDPQDENKLVSFFSRR